MSEKFKYAPGKPGYGTKGDQGEDGQQGLAMYFTDINPTTNSTLINSRIQNNLDLWSIGGNPLPNGRVYVTGDLFFDSEGKAYEINAESQTFQYKFASINIGGFFVPLGKDTSNGFERYFNSNSSPKFIIDNVYTISGAIDYTAVPTTIYDTLPKNFTRIEYTNIKPDGSLNAFTVYTSGEVPGEGGDNHKALAIVYNEVEKAFHIGNLDNLGLLRNTNLIFDVSLLRQKKEEGKNTFNVNTPEGAVLTNYEIKANSIFDPNFEPAPSSFYGTMGTTNCSINWTLADFVNGATNVYGDLYFYENNYPYHGKTFSFINDVSLRPLIFSNVSGSGYVTITGCSSTKTYAYYMKLYTDTGWTRNSEVQNLFKGAINVTPTSYTLSSSDAVMDLGFNVDANFTWNASIYQNPDNFMSLTCTSIGGLDGSILVDVTDNASTNARLGKIRVHLLPGTAIYKDISIYQPRGEVGPELFLYGGDITYSFWPSYYLRDASQDGTIDGASDTTVDVSSNRNWSITSYPSWVNIAPLSGLANTTTPVTISFDTNSSIGDTYIGDSRSGAITFNNGSIVTLNVLQDPNHVWMRFYDTDLMTDVLIPIQYYGSISLDFYRGTDMYDPSEFRINYMGDNYVHEVSPYSNDFPFYIEFEDDSNPIPWAFIKTDSLPWYSMYGNSGTGSGGPITIYVSPYSSLYGGIIEASIGGLSADYFMQLSVI